MGKPIEQALGEVDFAADIYAYYAENAPKFLEDEKIELRDGEGSAFIRRNSLGVLLGIMPWNFPYYQVARFAGPNLIIGNTIILKHASQCPESAAAMEKIFLDAGFPEGAYVNVYAVEQPDGVGHRRPARAGRLAHRFRGRRRGRRRDRGPPPQEGRPRAGRVGPLHPAQHRRPGWRGRGRGRRTSRQQRSVLQRGEALHRDGRPVRAVPREVHRRADEGCARRPDVGRHRARPAVVARGGRGAAGSARPRGRAGRTAGRGRQARRRVLPGRRARRRDARQQTRTTRSSSARSASSTRCRPKTRP